MPLRPLLVALSLSAVLASAASVGPVPIKWLGDTPAPLTTGVSFGVPWPRGAVQKSQAFALTAADGSSLPVQTWPLAYWPDGTVKWTGVATVTGPATTGEIKLTTVAAAPAAAGATVTVRHSDTTLLIDTGRVQAVISGDKPTLERGLVLAKESGARRAVPLAVSIASHSPLMQSAADQFNATLQATHFQVPSVPVYGNTSASPLDSVEAIRHELAVQLTQSVRWTETIQTMIGAGANRFIELGLVEVDQGELRALGGQRQRHRATETLAATGHRDDLVL